jgi:RiboL-PSP-HEPN
MGRYTNSYGQFLERLGEVHILRKSAAKKERENAIRHAKEIRALCRASVVLLSSHVEAFIKELGETALEAFFDKRISRSNVSAAIFYNISKDVIAELSASSESDKIAEKMFEFLDLDLGFWSKVGPFPNQIPSDRFNKGFASPAFKKVVTYFGRFGYRDFKRDFDKKLSSESPLTINALDHMVAVRNNIAHGDESATKTPSEVEIMIKIVSLFCRSTDDVFSSWCKKNHCSIR